MARKSKVTKKTVLKNLNTIRRQVKKFVPEEHVENVKGAVGYLKNHVKGKIGNDGLTDKERTKMAEEYGRKVRIVSPNEKKLIADALVKHKQEAEDRRKAFLFQLARAYMLSQVVPKVEMEVPVNFCPDDDPVGEPRPMKKVWSTDVNAVVEKMAKLLEEKGYDFSKPRVRMVDLGVDAEERAAAAEEKLEQLRTLMNTNEPSNDFYVNGFPNQYEALGDLYDPGFAKKLQSILEPVKDVE